MNSFEAIGGYFELSTNYNQPYYKDLLALNTGRNALEYLLLARQYKKIYLPYFTCSVILEPIKKLRVDYEFYRINLDLEPVQIPDLRSNEVFLYVNYFGLKSEYISELKTLIGEKLIIDNAQAFYCEPEKGVDTFYSPRKFFGIPDGAYLSTEVYISDLNLQRDISVDRCAHLLKRLDNGAEAGYDDFKANEDALLNQPIKQMSRLSEALLSGIEYESVCRKRNENFKFLHKQLQNLNKLDWIDVKSIKGPLAYPFYSANSTLRDKLIENKIYTATYWPNVFDWIDTDSLEYQLAKNVIPLPIDQRYQVQDLAKITEIIYSCS